MNFITLPLQPETDIVQNCIFRYITSNISANGKHMSVTSTTQSKLQDSPIDVKIKLAALWAATMFCYLYGDYFELYVPGKLSSMLEGKMLPLGTVTQGMLVGTSVMMAVQCVMVFLPLVMKPAVNRWVNLFFGLVFAVIVLLVISQGGWIFYKFLGVVEIALLLAVVWQAWNWPRIALAEKLPSNVLGSYATVV